MHHNAVDQVRHAAVAGAVAAVLLVACGGGDDDDDTATADTEEELLDYVECLRGQGLDIEDPQVDADGNLVLSPQAAGGSGDDASLQDSPTQAEREAFSDDLQAAQETCGELPDGVVTSGRGQDDTATQDAMLDFAQCLRDHGIDVDDPDPNSDNPTAAFDDMMDSSDPEVQAAAQECQEVFTDVESNRSGDSP